MYSPATTIRMARSLLAAGAVLWLAAVAWSAPKSAGDAYPLDRCIVSGEKLGSRGEPVTYDYNGREIKFCCPKCVPEFEKNAASYIAKLDSAIIDQQLPYYPLTTCVVSGEKFGGDMGKPVNLVYNNRLVRFCCKGCTRDFLKDPAAYLSKIDSAVVAQQKPTYPLDVCPVSGEKLGKMGAPVDYVQGNRLVRFCCNGCVAAFRSNPTAYLAKIDAAKGPGTPPAQGKPESPKKSN